MKKKLLCFILLVCVCCGLIFIPDVFAEELGRTTMQHPGVVHGWGGDWRVPHHWLTRLDRDYPNVMKQYDTRKIDGLTYNASIWGIGSNTPVSVKTVNGSTHSSPGGYSMNLYLKNASHNTYDGWCNTMGAQLFTEHFSLNGQITYCFDINTPSAGTVNSVSLSQINHFKSDEELRNIAKAAKILTEDNFKFFRDNAEIFAKAVPETTIHGVTLPSVSKADIVEMLSANTDDTNKFLQSLVQCMVWYHANDASSMFDSLGGGVQGVGGSVGGKDNGATVSAGYLPAFRGIGYMVDFESMYEEALSEFNTRLELSDSSLWLWQKWYSIKPGETLTLSGAEGDRVWQIYNDNGYFGSSQLQISRNSSNQTVIVAPSTITPFSGEWQESITINDTAYAVLNSNGQYVNRDKAIWEEDKSAGQFVVNIEDIKAIRAGIDVKQVDKYLYVTKKVPTGFSANGATFGVYESQADATSNINRLTTLSITNGQSDVYKYTPTSGENTVTLYVKELTTPTSSGDYEWIKDDAIKPVTLTEANSTSETAATVEFTNNVTHYGYLQIHKNVPTGHVPTGAEYTIYQNANCTTELPADKFISGTKEKLIITSTQDSNVVGLRISGGDSIIVYVKETKQPNETGDFTWQMDSNVYPVTVTKDTTKTTPVKVNSENKTVEYGYVTVKKAVTGSGTTTNPQNVSPYGARYAVFDTREHAQAWINNQSTTGILGLIGIDANGNGTANVTNSNEQARIQLPLSQLSANTWETKTVYIVETKLPNATSTNFTWDTSELSKIYTATINKDSTPTTPVMVNTTNRYTVPVKIVKTSDAPSNTTKQLYPIDGAQFTIYTDSNYSNIAKDKDGRNAILTIQNGVSNEVWLDYGTYYFRETIVPTGYTKAADFSKTLSATNNTFSVINHFEYGSVRVNKLSDRPDIASTYPINGAEFTIYTNSSYSNIAKTITGEDAILTVVNGTTAKIELRPGTYYIKETKYPDSYQEKVTFKKVSGTTTTDIPANGQVTLNDGDSILIQATDYLENGQGKVEKSY